MARSAVGGAESTLFLGLPTPATVGVWFALLRDAGEVLRSNAAPAPTTAGVAFLLTVSIGLIALAGDVIGVTFAMPALAGLPLLAPYLTAVANGNGALPWPFFVTPAIAWLLLLADADHRVRRRWLEAPRRPDQAGPDPQASATPAAGTPARARVEASRWAAATAVGVGALVLALLTALVLPQMPVRYLAEGLGRGGKGGSGVVGFSTDLDLRTNLRAADQTPVLRYRTDDPSPGPLRVLVSDRFLGDSWEHQSPRARPTTGPHPPDPGYEVDTARRTLTVEETALDAPHVAAPFAIVDGSMTDAQWAIDERTGVAVVDRTPSSYELTYLVPLPDQTQLQRTSVVGSTLDSDFDAALSWTAEDDLTLRDALAGVVPEDASPYDAAVRIQDWLRSPAFTYSLDGVPEPVTGGTTPSERFNLLARFLREKRGYCTHFATTMVLAARSRGIPARMAYGFLPGTKTATGYEIRQSDAHAWPELYFPRIGWLRFEPTPAQRSGNAPSYAPGQYGSTAAPSFPTGTATSGGPTAAQTTRSLAPRDRDAGTGADAAAAADPTRYSRWRAVPAGLLTLATALLAMPGLARLARRRDRRRAADDAARAEVEWAYLTSALADLGFSPPASSTLRHRQGYYGHAAVLDGPQRRALETVTRTVERARYAPPGTPLPDVGGEADLVRRGARELRSWRSRARAWLWPGYAVGALRRATSFGSRGGSAGTSVGPARTATDGTWSATIPAASADRPFPPDDGGPANRDDDLFRPPRTPAATG